MVTYFPKYFSNRAILLYIILLLLIPIVFGYPMLWFGWLFGILFVSVFFYFSNNLSKGWGNLSGKKLEKKLFTTSVWIRLTYVVFSFFFYKLMTGVPFEFGAADAHWYDDMGRLGSDIIWGADIKWSVFFQGVDKTDIGYPLYLSVIYALTGKSILLTRCVKALISGWTVVLMYRLASRNFGESVGRMTGVFCMLMPNLVYYCGLHLKEIEMLFLCVFFIEKADYIFRCKSAHLKDLTLLVVSGISVYFFRGVLCALLFLTVAATVVFGSQRIKRGGKWFLESVFVIMLGGMVFLNMGAESIGAGEYSNVQEQQNSNIQWRSEREGGNSFAVSASSAVYAPLIFTIPFPTFVNIEYQQDQQLLNGGNFVKNITSFLTILGLLMLLLSGKWKENVLPIAFTMGYLIILVFSNYAHSERFHIPSLPFELMFAAYGVSAFKAKHKNWFTLWLIFIFVANLGWSWFKLRGRGM